jgi:hypothetical protein
MGARGADVAKLQRRLPRPAGQKIGKTKNSGKVSKPMQPETIDTPLPETAAPTRKSAPLKQELIAPHEWASLLNNIEGESDETRVGGEVLGEVELASMNCGSACPAPAGSSRPAKTSTTTPP